MANLHAPGSFSPLLAFNVLPPPYTPGHAQHLTHRLPVLSCAQAFFVPSKQTTTQADFGSISNVALRSLPERNRSFMYRVS